MAGTTGLRPSPTLPTDPTSIAGREHGRRLQAPFETEAVGRVRVARSAGEPRIRSGTGAPAGGPPRRSRCRTPPIVHLGKAVIGREHMAAVRVDRGADDPVMARQRRAHRVRKRIPQRRRALDVGEQERHRARRRWRRSPGTIHPHTVVATDATDLQAERGGRWRVPDHPRDRRHRTRRGRAPHRSPRDGLPTTLTGRGTEITVRRGVRRACVHECGRDRRAPTPMRTRSTNRRSLRAPWRLRRVRRGADGPRG